jgi:hypothetical protein
MAKYMVKVDQTIFEYYEIETDLTDFNDIRKSFWKLKQDGPIDELTETENYEIIEIQKIGD